MNKTSFVRWMFLLSLIFTLAAGGCVSIPVSPGPRFYTLRTQDESEVPQKFNIAQDIIIGVGPVRIPEYLNRPQIVTQDAKKMLTFAQFDRWGESLDIALTRLIGADLSVALPQANLNIYPWNLAIPVKYQVFADVIQLESELQKDLFFVVQWSLIDAQNNKMLFMKRSEFRKPVIPQNYSGLVETLSSACASLSSEIAEKIAELAKGQ